MQAVNPATGEAMQAYAAHDDVEVARRIDQAQAAFLAWRDVPLQRRCELLKQTADVLRRRKPELARLITLEMGKRIGEAEVEIEKCAWNCDWYADNAPALLLPKTVATDAAHSYVRYDPLGPLLAVMPWNFPFWQVFRFAAPALAAGNVALLKHASCVPGCALAIEDVFARAGVPQGVFSTLMIGSAKVADVIAHPAVRAVTLTGSEEAGAKVAAQAGKAIKKTVMELGGSDPFIVLPDADLDATLDGAVQGRMMNAGQSCIAAKRFIVVEPLGDAFAAGLAERLAALRVGDPLHPETQLGPLAREDLVTALDRQVRDSIDAGATLRTGGACLSGPGYFYAATVLDHVRPGMPAFDQETFGPVAAVIRARDEAQALALANQNRYGLGASIWTRDTDKAQAMAACIDAGAVFINSIVKSDPRLPFGGVKLSGYGRELAGVGMREFVNIKTVWVA